MNKIQRIAKNTTILFAAQILGYVLSFFYTMYNARYLGAAGFGVLMFALAFAGIFGILTDFGFQPLIVREVSRNPALVPKYLANVSGMKVVMAVVTFSLATLTINLLNYPKQTVVVVYLIALSVIVSSFTLLINAIFQAYERMEYQSFGQVLNGVLMLLGVLFAIKMHFSVVAFASLYLLVSVCVFIYSFFCLNWKILPGLTVRKVEVDWNFWKRTFKEAAPFGLAIAFVTIFYWIDSVMLSLMKGDEVVGWYNAAFRLVHILLFIPQSFVAAIYPVMSRFYQTSENSLQLSYEKSFKFLTIIGIPFGVATMFLAGRVILPIFGNEYGNSILPLQILIWSSVFVFMSVPIANLFNCLNKQVLVTKITGFCAVFNILLNLVLIPRYSLVGASVATLLTEFLSLFFSVLLSVKIGYNIFRKDCLIFTKIIAAVVLMGLLIYMVRELPMGAIIPLAVLFYFSVLYLTKGIDNQDLDIFRGIFREKSRFFAVSGDKAD